MTTPITLQVTLTAQQQRDFAACAETCGLDLATWIVQCAAVQAAAVIDAVQATQRKRRAKERAASAPSNAQKPRLERPRTESRAPAADSPTMKAARSYNAQFRSRPRRA